MVNVEKKIGKRVTVVGLGRSGIGAARLLAGRGTRVTVTDCRKAEKLTDAAALLPTGVSLVTGGHPASVFEDSDMVVVSPGVPTDTEQLKTCRARGIPVIGELELAYRFTDLPFIAITGTNGKSTVTSMVGEMINASDSSSAFVGGNLGNSLCEGLAKMEQEEIPRQDWPNWIVAEVSSFQLETTELFRPKVAAVLNISPDHLDRYSSMDEYISTKANIFKQQTKQDSLVLNADDPVVSSFAASTPNKVAWFGLGPDAGRREGIFLRNREIHFRLNGRQGKIIHQNSIRIKGTHNLENAMAAACLSLLAGVRPGVVADVLREFPGLEHRVEFFTDSINGVTYVNDSKGTNVGAVEKSLQSFSEPVILIAGGVDKKSDFSLLLSEVSKRVKTLVLIGEAAEKMAAVLGNESPVIFAHDIDDAVQKAQRTAVKGDVVLLSPACASFDMFANFEDRGNHFKDAVKRLSLKCGNNKNKKIFTEQEITR